MANAAMGEDFAVENSANNGERTRTMRFAAIPIALGILILTTGCESPAPTREVRFSSDSWSFRGYEGRKMQTDHFDVYSTLVDSGLEEALPAFLEAAYEQYSSLLPPPDGQFPRLQTYVFDNRVQWEQFTYDTFPTKYDIYRRINAGGYAEGNQCVIYYLRRMYTLSVLAHEGMHQYFANYFKVRLPAWLNEGLATYCESYDLPGGKPRFTPQRNTFRLNSLRQSLSAGAFLPIRDMLSTDAGQVVVQGRSRVTTTYYAQAWAMTVFIRHGAGGRYSAGFDRLLEGIVAGDMPRMAQAAKIRAPEPSKTSYGEAVFRAYITEDLEVFEREFKKYLYELAGFKVPS